jgi:hypothetical protein
VPPIKTHEKRISVCFLLHYSKFIFILIHFYEIYYTLIYFSGFMGQLKDHRQQKPLLYNDLSPVLLSGRASCFIADQLSKAQAGLPIFSRAELCSPGIF